MRRRDLLVGGLALPLIAIAQGKGRVPLVGLLISETLSGQATRLEALRAGLRDHGYSVEARNIAFEIRAAEGNYDRLPELAAELVRVKVDVLVAFGSKAVVAAKGATATIPIVVPSSGDPVNLGVVSGLSRPGGNVTGIAIFGPELTAKWLALLKETVPGIVRVGLLRNSANPSRVTTSEAMRAAAKSLKLELHGFDVRSPKEFDGAFAAMAKARVDAVLVTGDTLFQAHWSEITKLAAGRRLPSVGRREFAEAGGLIGYGQDDAELYRRGASFVDRILKGAKPADMPVERPTRFELVINLKAAKALGIRIPQSVLVRADRVIE